MSVASAPPGGSIDVSLHGALGAFRLDAAFQVPGTGVSALFGPSGCGKTSILRSLAGLQHVPGHVRVGDEIWQDDRTFRPPHRRPVGYVFQEASLFSHLSVRANLLFGARRVRGGATTIRFEEVVDLLGLAHLIDRDPAHLSGGERQRVAIGRALLSQPRLLLMDEPLSALDRMAKDEILPYFEALHARLSLPVLLVTHDFSEVVRLADHLVVLKEGRVVSSEPLHRALTDAASPFAQGADFAAVLNAVVVSIESDGIVVLRAGSTSLLAVGTGAVPGSRVRVRIAARDVSLARHAAPDTSILNLLPARILGFDPVGTAETNVRLSLETGAQGDLVARLSNRSLRRLNLAVGERVIAQVKAVSVLRGS